MYKYKKCSRYINYLKLIPMIAMLGKQEILIREWRYINIIQNHQHINYKTL